MELLRPKHFYNAPFCRMKMHLSIIVPAYNEAKRITPFLTKLLAFAKEQFKDYEILCVEDGSKDDTIEVIKRIGKGDSHLRIISYIPNQGKAHAVRTGIIAAKGKKILFIDADGSIQPEEIPKMLSLLDSYDVVVGTRYTKEANIKQPLSRQMTSFFFNTYVKMLFNINVQDTLCGFKGFKRDVGRALFDHLVSRRWIFDVELFYKIRKQNYSLYELPITWEHKDDTKFKLFDPVKMIADLAKLRYALYKAEKDEKKA